MLTNMAIRNFKSWRDTGEIRLAPITALFGTNSSGKTSLLQLLLMLKQTCESPDRNQVLELGNERSLVELGTYREVVHNHDVAEELVWKITWRLAKRYHVADPAEQGRILFEGDSISFSAFIAWFANGEGLGRAIVDRMAYNFAGTEFGMEVDPGKRPGYKLLQPDTDFRFVRTQGRPWELPPPIRCYGFPDQVRAYYQNAGFLADLELKLEELLNRVFYLGPLREYPKRQYQWTGARPSDMGRRGEKVVDALLASREAGRVISRGQGARRQTVEERVAWWLKELGLIAGFEVRPITADGQLFQVWVRVKPTTAWVLITDVGFGVSQILPVITLCYYVPEGSILILEQPEIHLHPAVQSGLADVFIDAIKYRNIQIILESHSEHLLRRLQRRMAEEQLSPDDAALYFCTSEKGESHLKSLELDRFGNITDWPDNFFGDEFGELAATQEAIIDRKLNGAA